MSDIFRIAGLGGKKTLSGSVSVGGMKNAILPALAASLLFEGPVEYENVPNIADVERMLSLLSQVGGSVKRGKDGAIVRWKESISSAIPEEDAKRMRASVILTGPILSRSGEVSFTHPGGCVIGARPIDFFLSGFQKMGAALEEGEHSYRLRTRGRLTGADIFLPVPSVTATETFLLAAVLAEGETVIRNAALEPEVETLARFLKANGALISGIGTPTLSVRGRTALLSPKKGYRTIPDRIEAGSFLILAALSGDSVEIADCEPTHMHAVIETLRGAGVPLQVGERTVSVVGNGHIENSSFKSFNIKTHEYPGFPTDLQAPSAVFLTQATGEGFIHEAIFEGRLAYLNDLSSMGADVKVWDAHRALVKGPTKLRGHELEGPDIRAGLAYLIASVVAEGTSTIRNVHLIDRGYENIEGKLSRLGVSIERLSE